MSTICLNNKGFVFDNKGLKSKPFYKLYILNGPVYNTCLYI